MEERSVGPALRGGRGRDSEKPVERWDVREYRHRLCFAFEALRNYRIRLEKALDSGVVGLSCDGAGFWARRKTDALNKIIRKNLSIIEEPLVTIISPENRSFKVADLAREFGYPDVDLNQIDLDWIV